ncbi:MAG: hypothetical protein ACWGO1_03560 [Anaerolineales bacterium]
MTFRGRIGQFFFFMGFLGLIIFFATDQADMPRFTFLCAGVLLFVLGIYMMWKYRSPPTPSERFSTLRRLREGQETRRRDIEEQKFADTDERMQRGQ